MLSCETNSPRSTAAIHTKTDPEIAVDKREGDMLYCTNLSPGKCPMPLQTGILRGALGEIIANYTQLRFKSKADFVRQLQSFVGCPYSLEALKQYANRDTEITYTSGSQIGLNREECSGPKRECGILRFIVAKIPQLLRRD